MCNKLHTDAVVASFPKYSLTDDLYLPVLSHVAESQAIPTTPP